jgi:uncharacterized protein YaaR (DUF327 family)
VEIFFDKVEDIFGKIIKYNENFKDLNPYKNAILNFLQ